MKKMMLGITWQILGFLGAIGLYLYSVAHRWNSYGTLGTLMRNGLLIPFVITVVLFVVGVAFCVREMKER